MKTKQTKLPKTITITVTVPMVDLLKVIADAGYMVTDNAKFLRATTSKNFHKWLADDLLSEWKYSNDDADAADIVALLYGNELPRAGLTDAEEN